MVSPADVDFVRVMRMAQEFADAAALPGTPRYECIYQSDRFGAARQVFALRIDGRDFALKYDKNGDQTNRLRDEYARLVTLHAHFDRLDRVAVPAPRYLSPGGCFFVTDYVGDRLASAVVLSGASAEAIGQVYRRAGLWLHGLHAITPPEQIPLWPNWMVEAVDVARQGDPQADAGTLTLMRNRLSRRLKRLHGRPVRQALCHGDFHAGNLILGKGVTFGFDFTEAQVKPAFYDCIDFLKIDAFRPGLLAQVDHSGLTRHAQTMFFKLYRHPIDMEVFGLCMRARLLIDWASISRDRYETSAFQRNKFSRFEERLKIAFNTGGAA